MPFNLFEVLSTVIPLLVLTAAIWASAHVLLNKRDSKSAFGWIALCIMLPMLGPILYLLFGINRVRTRAQKKYQVKVGRSSMETINEPTATQFRPLSLIGEKLTEKGLCSCDSMDVLTNGEELYPAMLAHIAAAKQRVLLASYIFDSNETGQRFVEALTQAQQRGVEVKVIIDGLGELMSFPRIGRYLNRNNIDFVRFNPVRLIPPALNINMRNHRKALIIDGKVAYTGGQNIGDRHLADNVKNPARVEDIHFRLTGKIVDELEWAFWQDWHYCKRSKQVDDFNGCNENNNNADAWSRLILDGPNKDLDKLNHLIVGVVSAARQRICIMTPYFLPTYDLIAALIAAHLRGVEICILLPSKNNIAVAHWASQNILRQLLESHLDIRYQPPPFIHSKLLLVDDFYSLIGSTNLDPRSLRLNYESCVELYSKDINQKLDAYFTAKAEVSNPITLEQIHNRSLLVRLRDSVAWLFSPYL